MVVQHGKVLWRRDHQFGGRGEGGVDSRERESDRQSSTRQRGDGVLQSDTAGSYGGAIDLTSLTQGAGGRYNGTRSCMGTKIELTERGEDDNDGGECPSRTGSYGEAAIDLTEGRVVPDTGVRPEVIYLSDTTVDLT